MLSAGEPIADLDLNSTFTVLLVSRTDDDYRHLRRIFRDGEWAAYTETRFHLRFCLGTAAAAAILPHNRVCVILLDTELADGTWQELVNRLSHAPNSPALIVTSRLADERLWAEALNLGAFDVFAKPFTHAEVVRGISLAWLHWRDRHLIRLRENRSTPFPHTRNAANG